jgi:hypothetical protein
MTCASRISCHCVDNWHAHVQQWLYLVLPYVADSPGPGAVRNNPSSVASNLASTASPCCNKVENPDMDMMAKCLFLRSLVGFLGFISLYLESLCEWPLTPVAGTVSFSAIETIDFANQRHLLLSQCGT